MNARAVTTAATRLSPALQLVLGIVLIVRPAAAATVAAGPRGRRPPRWLVRILGFRTLAQAVAILATPTPTAYRLGATADALHAISMLPVAVLAGPYRRSAAASGAVAAVTAAAGAAAAAAATPRGAL